LRLFRKADELAVGGLGGDTIKLFGGAGQGVSELLGKLRFEFANGFFGEVAGVREIVSRRRGLAFDALDDFLGADAEAVHLGIPAGADFVEAVFEAGKQLFPGSVDDRAALLRAGFRY